MSGLISLTAQEQAFLNASLRLENAGYPEAAQWLRDQIKPLRGIDWTDVKDKLQHKHVPMEDLFRIHRGSLPPQPSTTITVTPLTTFTPSPRPDQTMAGDSALRLDSTTERC